MSYCPLSREKILAYTNSHFSLEVVSQVTSTNDWMKEKAALGEPGGLVLLAGSQTAGRGRMGRPFYSPEGTGLYLSLLIRTDQLPRDALGVTTASAVATSRAIARFTKEPVNIKWVNDIYVRDRKVCGILTESGSQNGKTFDYIVVGIGVNVFPPAGGFPPELSVAGAVFEPDDDPDLRNRLTAAMLDELETALTLLRPEEILEEYRRRSWLDHKTVTVHQGTQSYPATVEGIGDSFCLIVRTLNGERKELKSGEVSLSK